MKTAVCLLLISALCLETAAQEPWHQLGPQGAALAAMAGVPGYPNDLYFVPEGFPARLYFSADRGANWAVRQTIPDIVHALAVDPSAVENMYAAGRPGRVYRSVNAGRNWSVRGTIAGDVRVGALAVDPAAGSRVWAAACRVSADTELLCAYLSTDAGSTWSSTALDSSYAVRAVLLAVDAPRPHRVFVGGSMGNSARVFRTTDNGATWTDISSGLAGTCAYGLAVHPTDSMVLVCATDAGLYRSTDAGATWSRRATFPAFSAAFTPASPYYGYSGSDNLVFRSSDNGLNWSADTTAFAGTNTRWLGLNPSQPLELYAGNSRGVFHSSNGGFAWTEQTQGLSLLTVTSLSVLADSDHTFAATATGVGAMTSEDLGRTWTPLGTFPGSGLAIGMAASPRHPDTLVLVTERDPRMFLTTDRGDSWVSHRIADRFEPRGIAYHPLGADTLFAWGGVRDSVTGPTRFAVYRSTNSGQSWFMATSRTGAGLCHGFWIAPGAETLYAWGTANNGPVISRSADRGRNWTGIASGISGPVVRGFAASTADTGLLYCAATGGIFRSRNRGGNWTRVGLTQTSAVLPDPADTARIMAATDTQGVYLTTDAGRTWQRDTIALTGRTGLMFRRHPDAPTAVYLSAAGASLLGHGLIAIEEPRPAAPLSGIGVTPSVVNRSARFSAARLVGPAALKLYHADGRLACAVGTLDRIQPVLDWRRPAQLPAGVYLLELSGPDQRDLTKLILTP